MVRHLLLISAGMIQKTPTKLASDNSKGLRWSKRREYKKKIRESALYLSTVMDFFECAAMKLKDAAFGKDSLIEPRKNLTEEDAREEAELKIAYSFVEKYRDSLNRTAANLVELDIHYCEYSASIINDRLKRIGSETSKMVSNTQNCSLVTIIPVGTTNKEVSSAKKWLKGVGAFLSLGVTLMTPVLNYEKAMVDIQDKMSQAPITVCEASTYTRASNLSGARPISKKEKLDWYSDVSSSVNEVGKRLQNGKSTPSMKWVQYIEMRKVSSGNKLRQVFGIQQAKMHLNVGGWSVRYG